MASPLTRKQVAIMAEAILARGLDVDRLSEATGLHKATLLMIMRGELRPEYHIRIKLAEALGIDPAAIGDR